MKGFANHERHRLTSIVLAIVMFGALVMTSQAAQAPRGSATVRRKSRRTPILSIDQFKKAFQDDVGKIRMVVLLSPT